MNVCYNLEDGLKEPLSYSYLFLFHNDKRSLSREVGQFKNLKKIIIAGGHLEELPDEIGTLLNLERLHLTGNRLTQLPESLINCSNLSLLYLDNNSFTELPSWLGSLTNLTDLFIGRNNIEEIPSSFCRLKRLKVFSCRKNLISSLPEELSMWSSLEQLGIESNCFTELPDTVFSMGSLRYLSFYNNRVASIPESITQLSDLEYFWGHHNHLLHFPDKLLALPKLAEIDLRSNKIKNVDFESLAHKSNTKIDLRGNPLSTESRIKLEFLRESHSNIRIRKLSEKKKETTLFIARCNTKGIIYKINRTLLDNKIITEADLSPDAEFFSGLDLTRLSIEKKELLNRLKDKYFSYIEFLKLMGITDVNSIYTTTHSIDDWEKHLFTAEQMNPQFLSDKLNSPDPATREQAVYALAEIDEPSRFSLFCSIFPEDNMILNNYILEELVQARYEPGYQKICCLVEESVNLELLKLCISYINRFKMDDAKQLLLTLLNRFNDTSVQTRILMALINYPGAETAKAVLPLLFSPDASISYMAEHVLKKQDDKAYLMFLEEMNKRADQLVKGSGTDWFRLADIFVYYKGEDEILSFLQNTREEIRLMGLQLIEKALYSRGINRSFFEKALKKVQLLITGDNEIMDRAAEKTIRLISGR